MGGADNEEEVASVGNEEGSAGLGGGGTGLRVTPNFFPIPTLPAPFTAVPEEAGGGEKSVFSEEVVSGNCCGFPWTHSETGTSAATCSLKSEPEESSSTGTEEEVGASDGSLLMLI